MGGESASLTGALAGATFRFSTDAPDLHAYARVHLASLLDAPAPMPQVDATLRWHDGQPPRQRLHAFPRLAAMERVDRDLYAGPGELHWFRVDDLRDLFLRFTWREGRLTVEGDFFHRLGQDALRDRARRVLAGRHGKQLRQRRFTTLLYYLVYYPCWWWLEQMHDAHPIHAAGVRTDAGVILLAGASGVGKSTLAVGLAGTPGARLLSDSFVLHTGADVVSAPEPILLDAWSRRWLGEQCRELLAIDWRYGLDRDGYQWPPERLAAGGRAALLVMPRRAPKPYTKRLAPAEAHHRLSAADLMINDLRRYWAFAAVLEQMNPAGLVARREQHLAALTAAVPCYELGLTADMTCAAAVEAVLQLVPERSLRVAGAGQ
jgi:hypothetical protein